MGLWMGRDSVCRAGGGLSYVGAGLTNLEGIGRPNCCPMGPKPQLKMRAAG